MWRMPRTGLATVFVAGLGLAACGSAPPPDVGMRTGLWPTSGQAAPIGGMPGASAGPSQVRMQLLRLYLPRQDQVGQDHVGPELVGEEAPAHLLLDGAG